MPRYKLTIEYDGTPYSGWQRQDDRPSVQQALEDAVEKFCGVRVPLFCAGRTDAGVHALAQVAHVDIPGDHDPFRVMQALNAHLVPQPVSVLNAELVDEEFHARFSAKGRHYMYRIINRRGRLTLDMNRALHVPVPLDLAAMREAAKTLVGHHDFTTFRDSACQSKSPFKTLDRLEILEEGEELRVHASARSFLHHQVRNMVGTLVEIGKGRWGAEKMAEMLEARDRRAGGPTAAPDGLYFMKVDYD